MIAGTERRLICLKTERVEACNRPPCGKGLSTEALEEAGAVARSLMHWQKGSLISGV
jgi:hypothetical protein